MNSDAPDPDIEFVSRARPTDPAHEDLLSSKKFVPDTGVCALVGGEQVAVFRIEDQVYAVGNRDPFSDANVLSRGIVGDLKGELVVASPIYKQHFSLLTGRCVEDASVRLPVYAARVEDGVVHVEPKQEVATTCCYCGVGCGVLAAVSKDEIFAVRGDPSHPANFGRLCSKGLSLHEADPSFRALYPEVDGRRVSWDAALDRIANQFRQTIAEHGADAVAFYISGQLLTEDYYVFNKLAKGLLGTNNIDTNSRLCMASAVAAYKQTLGADAPPSCYEDIEAAECIFIAGSNTAWAHPILFQRIEKAAPRHLIVVDPRRTETARAATLHLQITPGSDIALFNGMLQVMLREGWCDLEYIRRHTENFERLDLEGDWAAICGIPANDMVEAARLFATSRATLSLYCQGLNQSSSGTAKNAALINLHLATGQIGRPGAGPFSLTGQPNAMGGREVGGMANLLSAHRDLTNAEHQRGSRRAMGRAERPGTARQDRRGNVRSGTQRRNQSDLDRLHQPSAIAAGPEAGARGARARRARRRAGRLPQHRDRGLRRCLPPRRRVGREGRHDDELRAAHLSRACGGAAAGRSASGLAHRGGFRRGSSMAGDCFHTRGRKKSSTSIAKPRVAATWTSAGFHTRCSTSGVRSNGRFRPGLRAGRKRLYEDGRFATPSGRARFVPTPFTPVAEDTDDEYPLRLTTGRLRDQWHSMSRTGTMSRAFAHEPEPRVMVHPEDLTKLALKQGELVRITSRRGELVVAAAADADLLPGTVFLAMHWGGRHLGGRGINALTIGALDPLSRQPELKHCAVRIEPARLPWRLVASAPAANASALMQELEPVMRAVPYALRTLDGAGVRLSLAAEKPVSQQLLKWLGAVFEQGAVEVGDAALAAVRGRTLCNCFGVAESEIDAFAAASKSLAELQAKLRCGTNCGSCLPELRRKLATW